MSCIIVVEHCIQHDSQLGLCLYLNLYLYLHLRYICGAVGIVFIMLTNHGSWAKPVWFR